ncbi:glycolate oxidase iron-sulfur subunit [Lentibacillus populi]|uniref:Glycolate oxidase iron-sulfur subunit n=1 Tax=Lentibacillus populi TaxID=1827502 RepID=A0A9W5U1Z6_9BACI|nr:MULTISPECIES: (Fe-S)-binding protein [Bacillaceae]MBT2216277.1 (Fe-S)-binding protein [Virgibacillus dakarensis]GGB57546.1 glycolate oxidase iron-sulfur subunit [Lentibacillus populi]
MSVEENRLANMLDPEKSEPPCQTKTLGNYLWDDLPDETKWADCVHCGMCLEACPTYQETGEEQNSPRGRVYLIKAVAEGKIDVNEAFAKPIFDCLDCRACETACPADVQVGALIEEARGQIRQAMPLTGFAGALNKTALKGFFPHQTRLNKLGGLMRFYQKSGLQSVTRKTGLLNVIPKHLKEMESILPEVGKPVLGRYPEVIPPEGETKQRVGMLTGCIMDVMFSDVNEATIRVLTHNGFEVGLPKNQGCCGALHVHAGERETGKELAKRNVEAFKDYDKVLVNAAGCGCALQEYHELFRNDPEMLPLAEEFSAKVEDVSKFLYDHDFERPKAEVRTKVTYHDACHLAHGQGVRFEPRQLLKEIPGVEMVDMPDADRCCGSAGIYNLTHPEMAGALLERKIADVPDNVEMISMGNPGCMLQMAMGVKKYGRSEKVVHTVQLLDLAYEKEKEELGVKS